MNQKSDPADLSQPLSASELKVLKHFRAYLMTPGDMLCFSGQEIDSMGDGIEDLLGRQMLVPEQKHGAYSLTPEGFKVMRAVAR